MDSLRRVLKQRMPRFARSAISDLKMRISSPGWEEQVLHDYAAREDSSEALRVNLVVPTLAPGAVFGGLPTGLEVFFECGRRAGAQVRILVDDFDRAIDHASVEKWARRAGLDPASIEICPRTAEVQPITVRRNDVFFTYNWMSTLNVDRLIDDQTERFGGDRKPFVYLIQDYEPGFYGYSSTHLFARAALELGDRAWGVFNSSQLHNYVRAQGHTFEREYVFEPRLAPALKGFLALEPAAKDKRILVYGRPTIPRNCFHALVRGLRAWTLAYPQYADWTVASAGLPHAPEELGAGREMRSLGKLTLEEYATVLRTTAIGVSLMASPHPSYPPLEMAHFGAITLTNTYFCKDLSKSHDNIVSLPDIRSDTIAGALKAACDRFAAAPNGGWEARSHMPEYLEEGSYPFLDQLAADIRALVS
jgi:hypothetical protein